MKKPGKFYRNGNLTVFIGEGHYYRRSTTLLQNVDTRGNVRDHFYVGVSIPRDGDTYNRRVGKENAIKSLRFRKFKLVSFHNFRDFVAAQLKSGQLFLTFYYSEKTGHIIDIVPTHKKLPLAYYGEDWEQYKKDLQELKL